MEPLLVYSGLSTGNCLFMNEIGIRVNGMIFDADMHTRMKCALLK